MTSRLYVWCLGNVSMYCTSYTNINSFFCGIFNNLANSCHLRTTIYAFIHCISLRWCIENCKRTFVFHLSRFFLVIFTVGLGGKYKQSQFCLPLLLHSYTKNVSGNWKIELQIALYRLLSVKRIELS